MVNEMLTGIALYMSAAVAGGIVARVVIGKVFS
jgi:hypothetical protein